MPNLAPSFVPLKNEQENTYWLQNIRSLGLGY